MKLARALILASLVLASPAAAAVDAFLIINQAGGALSSLSLRRTGHGEWRALAVAPAAGARARVSIADPDCAFDLRATLAGVGPVVWSGVNLCDVKTVTLNRDRSGRTWADYD